MVRNAPAALAALTAVRGPLAWLVVVYHFGDLEPFRTVFGGMHHAPLSSGPFAVDCFFALSGFILFHVHGGLGKALDPAAIRSFVWARLARIYPLHLALLLMFVLSVQGVALLSHVHPNDPAQFSENAFLQHLLLVQGWGVTQLYTWNYPSWSISSEWAAYMLAPLVFWVVLRLHPALVPIACLILVAAIACLLQHGSPSLRLAVPRVMMGFCLGALACRCRDLHAARLLPFRSTAIAAAWAVFVIMLARQHGGMMVAAFVTAITFHGLPRPDGRAPGRVARVLVYAGETSFAVYMGHAFVENAWLTLSVKLHLARHLDSAATALIVIVAVQGFASILHHGIELPAQRYLRRASRVRPVVPVRETLGLASFAR